MLHPKPKLRSAPCATHGSRGMHLSPSFPRVSHFITLCAELNVCVNLHVLSAADDIRPYLQLPSTPQLLRDSGSPRPTPSLPTVSTIMSPRKSRLSTDRFFRTRFKAAAIPLAAAPGCFLQFSTALALPNSFKILSTKNKTTSALGRTKTRPKCPRATAYRSTWLLLSLKNAACQRAPNARLLHPSAISRQSPPPRPPPPPAPRLLRPRPPSTPPHCCAS